VDEGVPKFSEFLKSNAAIDAKVWRSLPPISKRILRKFNFQASTLCGLPQYVDRMWAKFLIPGCIAKVIASPSAFFALAFKSMEFDWFESVKFPDRLNFPAL